MRACECAGRRRVCDYPFSPRMKKRTVGQCQTCGVVAALIATTGTCLTCYHRARRRTRVGRCVACGEVKPLVARGRCCICYKRPTPSRYRRRAVCAVCGGLTYYATSTGEKRGDPILCKPCIASCGASNDPRLAAHHQYCIRKYFGQAYLAEYLAAKGKNL